MQLTKKLVDKKSTKLFSKKFNKYITKTKKYYNLNNIDQ